MKTINTVAAVLVMTSVAASSASAATWYALDWQHGECSLKQWGPQAMKDYIRESGHVESTQIDRDDGGNIEMVVITDETLNAEYLMFPQADRCEDFLNYARRKGAMPARPDELE